MKRLSILPVLLVLFTSIWAVEKLPLLNIPYNISKTIKLPYSAHSTTTVFQDHQGMIWIGSYHGIIRYDGYNTTFYLTENSMRTKECAVMSIAQIDNQHLIVGSLGGLSYFNITNGKTDPLPSALKQIKSVRTLYLLDGTLWIGTDGNGVWKYNLRTEKIKHLSNPSIKLSSIYALCPVGNRMYVGALEGLTVIDMKKDKMTSIPLPNKNKFVNSLLWNSQEKKLLIGMEGELCVYSPQNQAIETCDLLKGNVFKSLAFDKYHHLLIGTDAGLYIYNLTTQSLHAFLYNAFHQSISNNVIWNITIDRDDNVWLATENGITIMENPTWYTYNNMYELTHSEYGNNFTSILQDANNNLWLGGENGLIKLNYRQNQVLSTSYQTSNKKYHIQHNRIRQIYEDSDHDVWIATDGSIAKYNPQNQQFDYYNIFNRQGESAKWAYNLYEDRWGRLWISSYSGGLFIINKQKLVTCRNGNYVDHTQSPKMEKYKGESCIRQILPGDKDEIWLCSKEFVIRKNIRTGKEQRIDVQNENASYCNHALWLSSQEGKIRKYDLRTQKLTTLNICISNGPITAFVQEKNNLWFSCSDGIFTINTQNDEITFKDIPKNMCLSGIYLPHSNQMVWGGENCISTYHINTQREQKEVYITSVSSKTEQQTILLPSPSEKIHLKSRDYVTFELSTLQYNPHQEIVFYYKLGDNNTWQSLKAGSNELSFAHISSGTYKLSLSSTNPAIDKNSKITTYYIVVPSPWYANATAVFIYIVIAIILAIAIIRRYKRHNQKLMEQHEKERSMELLRQKNEFFVNMSHELKTPLSLIIAPLGTLIKATQQNAALKKALTDIQRNALQLNMLIHKVLEFKNKDFADDDSLIRSHIDINALTRNCLESFSSVALERNIQLNFNSNNEEVWMNIDTLKMQSAITNLISNAIKFVKNNTGEITVSVHQEKNHVIIDVEDNGIGIPAKDAKMIFIRFYQGSNPSQQNEGSGIGLYLVKKYIELHEGSIELCNTKNTKFTITLPLDGANAIPNIPIDENKAIDSSKDTIIVIDDNREIVSVLRNALQEKYNCITAFDGKDGLEKIEKLQPSLIIVDQMMPVMNGFQLVRQVKHNYKTVNIPIIMLTAKDDQATELQSIKLGIDVFLTKPFDLTKIILQVSRMIEKKSTLERTAKIEAISNPQFDKMEETETYDEKLIAKITSIIEDNIEDETFNVTSLAEKMGLPQKQLYRKLKQLTGITPVAYIKKIRMKKAAFLIKNTQYSITEIMYMIGYSNMSYFIKCFNEEYAMTPKQFFERKNDISF